MKHKPCIRASKIEAALRAEISPDELTPDEQELFGTALLDKMASPSVNEHAFYEKLRKSSAEDKK